jgi:hypothetical protein
LSNDDITTNDVTHSRPPDPVEEDKSMVKSEQYPITSGKDILILGIIGEMGSSMITFCLLEIFQLSHGFA